MGARGRVLVGRVDIRVRCGVPTSRDNELGARKRLPRVIRLSFLAFRQRKHQKDGRTTKKASFSKSILDKIPNLAYLS